MSPELLGAADLVAAAVWAVPRRPGRPVLVALDGGSGSGKSTLAALLAARLDAAWVPADAFYAAHIPDAGWDTRTPAERAADALDWRRLRAEALDPLLAGRRAVWYPFDFASGARPDGTYARGEQADVREPAAVVVLDGAYCTRPELADLIDLSVLVDVPVRVRHARLRGREAPGFLADWHRRWDEAEAWYFSRVRPPSGFDLVVTNG